VNSRTLTVTPFRANGPMVVGEPQREKRRPRRALAKVPNNMGYPENEVRITGTNLRGESPVGAEILSFSHEANIPRRLYGTPAIARRFRRGRRLRLRAATAVAGSRR
jgi:hypothetical protein